jgi:SAM-dependent methyltransferase
LWRQNGERPPDLRLQLIAGPGCSHNAPVASPLLKRIGWAVARIAAQGPDSLLEVGCGPGVAVALIAPRLTSGRILALDRSESAITAARERNRKWEALGRARFLHSPLRDLADKEGRFDKIFAINVNLFWLDAKAELPLIKRRLKDKGRLYLFYEPPHAQRRQEIAGKIATRLSGSGLLVTETVMEDVQGAPQLGVIAGHE